jgi:hypothetical protein
LPGLGESVARRAAAQAPLIDRKLDPASSCRRGTVPGDKRQRAGHFAQPEPDAGSAWRRPAGCVLAKPIPGYGGTRLSARRVRHQVDVATGGKIPSVALLNFLRFTAICEAVLATDLCTAFNQYFELLHADSDQLREEVFRLRYQVYIVETGFERCEDHPNGIERDALRRAL